MASKNTLEATAIPPLDVVLSSFLGPFRDRPSVDIIVNDGVTCLRIIIFALERTGEGRWEYRGFFTSPHLTLPPRRYRVRGILNYQGGPSWITFPAWVRAEIEKESPLVR